MSHPATLIVCDHHCRGQYPVNYKKLESHLRADPHVGDVLIVPTACRNPLPPEAHGDDGPAVLAGCPRMLDEHKGSGPDTGGSEGVLDGVAPLVSDTRLEVFDLYRNKAAIQENLARKLVSLAISASAVSGDHLPRREPAGSVLVVGSGLSGTLAALELSALGAEVEIAGSNDTFYSPGSYHLALTEPDLQHRLGARLAALLDRDKVLELGALPRALSTSEGIFIQLPDGSRRHDLLILMPELVESDTGDPDTLTLAECYRRVETGESLRGSTCFLLDQSSPTDPGTFTDVLHAARTIVQRFRGRVTVCMRDARVATTGGERLYDSCRETGVVFLKYGDDLAVTGEYGDFVVSGVDTQSGELVRIDPPNTLVIPGEPILPEWARSLTASLGVRDNEGRNTQDESLWLLPNSTNRAAIFTGGASRRRMDSQDAVRDAVSAALAASRELSATASTGSFAVVTEGSCARCLTCVRSCPFGAIRKEPGKRAAYANPLDCLGCGICAALCPARAIEMKERSAGILVDSIGALRGLAVLHCAEGGRRAIHRMIESGRSAPSDVSLFEVPCTGRVDESLLLDLFGREIHSALVVGCRKENCRFLDGNLRGESRVRNVQRILESAGIERPRAEMVFVAPDEGERVYEAIMQAHAAMSRNPEE